MKGKKGNKRVLTSRGLAGPATKGVLRENAAGPSFVEFLKRIKDAMKNYSSVVLNSVGLIVGDASYVFKILTMRLAKSSTYNRMKSEAQQARNRRLGKISSSMDALDNVMGPDSLLMYCFAPGASIGSKAFRVATFQDKGTNEWINDLNMDRLPIIGGTIAALTLRQEGLFENLDWLSDDAAKSHYMFLMGYPDGQKPPPTSSSIIGKAWDMTQALFLLDFSSNESLTNRKPLLMEQSDSELESKSLEELKALAKEKSELAKWDYPAQEIKSYDDYAGWLIGKLLEDNTEAGDDFLEEREKALMEYFEQAAAVVGHYSTIVGTDDIDELLGSLKAISKFSDGEYDADQTRKDMQEKLKEMKTSEKIQEEYKKALKKTKTKVEPGQEEAHFDDWLKSAAVVASKAKLLKSLEPVFIDFIDDLDDLVKEGISDDMIKMMQGKSEWKPLLEHFAKFDTLIENKMAPMLNKVRNNS